LERRFDMTTLHRRPVTRRRAIGTLAAAVAATVIAGGSSASAAPIPYVLDFAAPVAGTVADKDGEGTGFESVQPNKNGSGHLPGNIDLVGGQLLLTSTAGDTGRMVNTQANALQVTVTPTNGYTVSALIDGPLPVTTPFQSAGIYVGPDQDNYVKLVAVSQPGGTFLQFIDEQKTGTSFVHQISSSASLVSIGNFANINTLDLEIVGDASTGKLQAFYRVNGGSLT
jgi:hypothetical protein